MTAMSLRKCLGMLCIAVNTLGIVLELFEYSPLTMLILPSAVLHVLLYIAGAFWLSEDASRNKRMIAALLSAIAALYVTVSTLVSLHNITPMHIINFFYLPLAVVLYISVLRETKE